MMSSSEPQSSHPSVHSMSHLQVTVHHQAAAGGDQATIKLSGSLDSTTVHLLEARLKPALEVRPAHVVFDLEGLNLLTSAGVRLFMLTSKQQKQQGGQATFIHLQPQIREVFQIIGSVPGMKIFSNTAELDAYLIARQKAHGSGE